MNEHPIPLHSTALVVWRAVADLTDRNRYGPSVREIQAHTGISSPSVVAYALAKLADAGIITHAPGKARTIRLIERPVMAGDTEENVA